MKYLMTVLLLLCSSVMQAQQKPAVTLNDILKVDLYNGSRVYEITQGSDGRWSCWHTKSTYWETPEVKMPALVKTVPETDLNALLDYFNRPDSSRNIAWFDLKYEDLSSHVDSLKGNYFNPEQKEIFLKALANQDTLIAAMNRVFAGIKFVHSPLKIKLTTKAGAELLAISDPGAVQIYYLPWKIGPHLIYNPGITRLFSTLIGTDHLNKDYKKYLTHRMVREVFWASFRTKFHWDDLQRKYPDAIPSAGPFIKPWRFSRAEDLYHGHFTSVRLPSNWVIGVHTDNPDSAMRRIRKAEEIIVNAFTTNRSDFDNLKPTGLITFTLLGGFMDFAEGWNEDDITEAAASYPELKTADRTTLMFIDFEERAPALRTVRKILLQNGKLIPVR